MPVKVGIHQPQYFMWIGLLHKMLKSDLFVVLDNVQFNRRWYQHRALYSTKEANKYLTIPVNAPNHQIDCVEIRAVEFGEPIEKILKKHYETLRHRYLKSPGWKAADPALQRLFSPAVPYANPYQLILESMKLTLDLCGVPLDFLIASSLNAEGKKDELMLDLTRKAGGTVYYSGVGAQDYMREDTFSSSAISVEFQQFVHPKYEQKHGGPFHEGSAALDYFLEDPEGARDFCRRIREESKV